MLAVDFFELLDRVLRLMFGVQVEQALVVQAIGRLVRRRVVFAAEQIETGEARAGAEAQADEQDRRNARQRAPKTG